MFLYGMAKEKRLSTKDVARILGVHELTVLRWIKIGILPDRRLPNTRKHWFLASDLQPQIQTESK